MEFGDIRPLKSQQNLNPVHTPSAPKRPKLRMSWPNQERSDPIGASQPRRSVSLLIEKAQDQDLGSWKLLEVIARYSRRTLVDKNLNFWPSAVHHHRPSKVSFWKPLHAFELEIERTLHRLRKVRHIVTPDSSSSDFIWNSENSNFTTDESNFYEHQEARLMENNNRTLKELAIPEVVYQPWCIQCPPLEPAQSYELKSSLIHLMLSFMVLSSQALKGVPRDLFHDEAVGDTRRLHQDESVSILPGWSYKRLVVSIANSLQYLRGYEAHVPEEILPSI
ncbi:hypothetical protein CR513_34538, partial [Mucuna pruriens]